MKIQHKSGWVRGHQVAVFVKLDSDSNSIDVQGSAFMTFITGHHHKINIEYIDMLFIVENGLFLSFG